MMKILYILIYFSSFLMAESPQVNGDELQKLNQRSVELFDYIQKRCVSIMKNGHNYEKSGVIVSSEGHVLSSYIKRGDESDFIIFTNDGKRLSAELIDTDIRLGVSLLKIKGNREWPSTEIAGKELRPNSWGFIGGFGQERIRSHKARIRLARIRQWQGEDKERIICDVSTLQGDSGAPLFDLNGRLMGIVSAIGTQKYSCRVMHISVFEDIDSELMEKLRDVKVKQIQSLQDLKNLTVSPSPDDEDNAFFKNIEVLQTYFSSFLGDKVDGIVQVKSSKSPTILGSVISDDGYVLTKATEVGAELSCEINGVDYPAILYGLDEELDLALLKVETRNLKPVQWAATSAGSFLISLAMNTEEMSWGIIGHQSCRFHKEFLNVNNPENKTSFGVAVEHGDNQYRIAAFLPDSPLKKAGANVGDIIIAVDGKATPDRKDVLSLLGKHEPGTEVKLTLISKDGKESELKCKLIKARTAEYPSSDRIYKISDLSFRKAGFPKVFIHDSIMEAWQCGAPVFDLRGNAVGINIARHDRTSTFLLPVDEIKKSIERMMKKSMAF